ncbi:MAG: hydroxymethylbilane synthase [Candidatus Nanopelagicales bacterium]|nr:hydroxymethylbilane synthase [Candidatus Nanopelagicales bacterium]
MPDLNVATRASALARAQTAWVCARIHAATGLVTSEVLVTSEGDTSRAALTSFGGQGVFVTAIREAVADGRADVAVHSMKDLPTTPDPRTTIAAVPRREDVRDFVVTASPDLESLPRGATVATGSPRRVAYLRRMRPDLQIVGIRGNVDSRVAAVESGQVHAVVIAAAGLNRLGLRPSGFALEPQQMLPAVGQGALAVEMRVDDPLVTDVAGIGDESARVGVVAERALLAGLRAGCSAPVGALTAVNHDTVTLRAAVLSPDGSQMYECTTTGPMSDAHSVGQRAADTLIGQGAGRILRRDT